MRIPFLLVGATIALTNSGQAVASPQENAIIARAPSAVLTAGTPIRLMVTKEVNSRTAKPGERFKLRVDAPVSLNGKVAIPVGAVAWGELIAVSGTKAAGGKGKLEAKLLFIELGDRQIQIDGSARHDGAENDAGVLLGVISFGVFGLLNKGGNATLKAGDVFTGYLHQDEAFSE